MKKSFMISILALMISAGAGAEGANIGAAWNLAGLQGAYTNNVGIEFRIPSIPLQWGLSFSLGSQATTIGLTGDYWIYSTRLVDALGLYVGVGGFAQLATANNQAIFFPGVRVPVGLNARIIKPLELFLEVAPSFGLMLRDPITAEFFFQGALGFRFWF